MNILYDGHIFRWQKFGGISRYFSEVIVRLPETWTPTILGLERRSDNLPKNPRLEVSLLSSIRPRRYSQPLKNRWWQSRQFARANVVHPTYYKLSAGLQLADIKRPLVATIHDFVHARYANQIEDADWTVRAQKEMIERADHIVCISQATLRDMRQRHPGVEAKTTVIPLGSSFPMPTTSVPPRVFKEPTFLFVGGRDGYKNFFFLLNAFARACQSHPRIRLHVAGNPLTPAERWQIHFLGIDDRVDVAEFPGQLQLQQYYMESAACLYPSRHEGFGMPALEAMACGTVSVSSNTTSLPEVVGDGGIMLDPTKESDWTECILQVANGNFRRDDLIAKGRARAALFSWDKNARQHIEVYNQFA